MAAIFASPRFTAQDDNGRPLVAGRLYTFENGTTTPAPTYQDAAGTILNTNPILLDGRGEAVIFLQPDQVYTFVLRNRVDSLIWSQNSVAGTVSSASLGVGGGAGLIGYDASVTYPSGSLGEAIIQMLAIANGLDVDDVKPWTPGTASTADQVWLYEKRLWSGFTGNLPSSPTFSTGHYFRKPSEPFTPQLFGGEGKGEASGTTDYVAIQRMFAAGGPGAHYYLGDGLAWHNPMPAGVADTWTVLGSPGSRITGNNVTLTCRPSVAPSTGTQDGQRAVIMFNNSPGSSIVGSFTIDGMEPKVIPVNSSNVNIGTVAYGRSLAIGYGVYCLNSDDVTIDVREIRNCLFNVWCKNSDRPKVRAKLNYSGQLYPVTGADLQYGAGIKVSDCDDIDIDVVGTFNTNATAEIEPNINGGKVKCKSRNHLSTGATLTDCHDVEVDLDCGQGYLGVRICQGSTNITGVINTAGNSIYGTEIVNFGDASASITGCRLDIRSVGDGAEGLRMAGLPGQGAPVAGNRITITSVASNVGGNGCTLSGVGSNEIYGRVNGSTSGVGMLNCVDPRLIGMNLLENTVQPYYVQGASSYNLEWCLLPNGMTLATGTTFAVRMCANLTTDGTLQFAPLVDLVQMASHIYVASLPTTSGAAGTGGLWVDSGTVKRA